MPVRMVQHTLDSIDLRILRALQARPDLSIAQLGETVGLSQTPCWRRLKRMQDEGFVKARSWTVDPDRLGLSVNVFAEVKLSRHDEETLEAFERSTAECNQVVGCFSMSGSSDYLLRILVRDVSEYEVLMKKVLLHLPGVGSINSSFALKAIKVTADVPI